MQALRDQLGPNLTQAHKFVSEFLKTRKLNEPFQDELLQNLVGYSPGKRWKPENLSAFIRAKRPPYNRPCLFAVVGGRTLDVSWVKCLRNLYEKHDKSKAKRQRAISAFRSEAERCQGMQQAHEKYDVGCCDACGKACKLAVDHDGKPFAQIVDEFLDHKGATLDSIALAWTGLSHEFRCRQLAAQWHKWHDEHAKLIGLCQSCNSSKGSGGYRHKK